MGVGNAAPIELLWTLITVLALLGHAYGTIDAIIDVISLSRRSSKGVIRFAAIGQIFISGGLLLAQLMFLVPGIIADITESPTRTGDPSPTATITIACFIIGEIILACVSLGMIWFREEVRNRRDAELSGRIDIDALEQ